MAAHQIRGPAPLACLAGVASFGAIGLALALTGAGLPFLVASAGAAILAGGVMYAALRGQGRDPRDVAGAAAAQEEMEAYRAATAAMRHDIRGVLSPALMMADRLLTHQDPAVQRAGQAVVRSVERATAVLSSNREALAPRE